MLKTQAADLIQAYCEKNIKRYNQIKNKLKSVGVQPVKPASFTSEKDRVFDKEFLQELEEGICVVTLWRLEAHQYEFKKGIISTSEMPSVLI
ncbi:hypothetical protein AgCh_028288 [Apium graveolens]